MFEETPFIKGMAGQYVRFEYRGRHGRLVNRMTPADVRWICERLQRLTDRQWQDAFRAGGYAPELGEPVHPAFQAEDRGRTGGRQMNVRIRLRGGAPGIHRSHDAGAGDRAVGVPAAAGGDGRHGSADPDNPFGAISAETRTEIRHAFYRLPLAALLGAMLAVRPKRKGTPPRQPAVIQTQIILAVMAAVVMLVVGSNLARAFGVVGAAGLVRYRAKVEDNKDAGVMLSTLAVGLACGVGQYVIAVFSAVLHPARALGHRVVRARGQEAVRAEDQDGRRHRRTAQGIRRGSCRNIR